MSQRARGLYEALITDALAARLREEGPRVRRRDLHAADAADRLALHLGRVVERAVAAVPDAERVAAGTALARELVALVAARVASAGVEADGPATDGGVLEAIADLLPDGTPEAIPAPLIPLLDTALLTNAPGEPRVGSQLVAEIPSADRIDVVMAFIRKSGIAPMMPALTAHCQAGRELRVLTTTYTGSTQAEALDALIAVGALVRVSYDISTTRLHAKAWLFERESGFSTAYIGSSNLTRSAQHTGLEWNLRVSAARNVTIVEKIAAVFESYWNSGDFVDYDPAEFAERTQLERRDERYLLSPIEVRPEPFQERLLEQVAVARLAGRHRNLLVSATGTGKTVMAAVDYARLRVGMKRARLLFVAHREEILQQSMATFRHALRDHGFGELWVGGRRPRAFEHVFASIQSLGAAGLDHLDPAHFDVVIVDEFHHAAAPTYRALLDRVRPVELLGLTATPERSDGLSVLEWFDGRIAAELRVWDAIDQRRLAPFAYFGVHDGLDLRELPWRRGRGYDVDALSNLVTADEAWARLVLKELHRRVDAPSRMRALGFCVSVQHAQFMARVFAASGLAARAVWADTPPAEREAALLDLAAGRLQVLFAVDLFNEGLDVPTVDTLLFLRPTDSPTLFIQQLGRGLRLDPSKDQCTVLDFVGQHRTEFRFDRRFRALLGGSRKDLVEHIERGFPFLPAGCHMELDSVARDIVLRNIREATPSRWSAKVDELRRVAADGPVTLTRYLDEALVDLDDVYANGRSWSDLRQDAGLACLAAGPHEAAMRRACERLTHVDDRVRIDAWRAVLARPTPPDPDALSPREQRLVRMLVASVLASVAKKDASLRDGCRLLWNHPQVCAELVELLDVLSERISHVPFAVAPELPLQVHARYSRVEIFAAFGIGAGAKVQPWQTGVHWAAEAGADLLAFTLDKTSGRFSPTTRYRDYAVSRELIHWESQSATRADSETGRRYREHARQGSAVMLFARLNADDRAFWFLGPATYVRHQSERPMGITWRLHTPLPGDLFASFAAAVA